MKWQMIYKLFKKNEWETLKEATETSGAPIDIKDGYIHFSTEKQLKEIGINNDDLANKKPEKSGRTLSGFRTVAIWEERYVTLYMLRRSIKSRVTLRKDYLIKLHSRFDFLYHENK